MISINSAEKPDSKRRIGMHAVAKEAGVSVATVSNVLNRPEMVSKQLQRRVARAVEKLGYIPNAAARSLRTGRAETIGAVVFDLANPFFAVASRHMSNAANLLGYGLTVLSTDQDPVRETKSLDFLLRQGVRGIVVTSAIADLDRLAQIRRQGIGVTLLAQHSEHPEIGSAGVDDYSGMVLLVQHLLSEGRTRIGFIDGPGDVRQHVARRKAIHQVLSGAGLSSPPHFTSVTASAPDSTGGRQSVIQLLEASNFQLDAVVCINDYTAVGAILGLQDAGLTVPHDVAVTGFDDIEMAALLAVPITTVKQPTAQLGQAVIEQVISTTDQGTDAIQLVIPPELIIRNSTVA